MKRLSRLFLPLKRAMPTSLFARGILILLVPAVTVQAVAIYIFYERHWESITRNISSTLAGEISLLVHEMRMPDTKHRSEWVSLAKDQLGMSVRFTKEKLKLPRHPDSRFESFRRELGQRTGLPAAVKAQDDDTLIVRIGLPREVMSVIVSKKRLLSTTTSIFTIWLTGSALLLFVVSILFLRNQIRPISRLARAAEGFGLGIDDPLLRPAGSREVRQATSAFLTMKARISRQMATRTLMLSGISHDLRTPLTRMKLELAMLPETVAGALSGDVREMEQMIAEYLEFARGEEEVSSEPVSLAGLLGELVDSYARHGALVTLAVADDVTLSLRRTRVRRAFDNLIGNALRYGERCDIQLERGPRYVTISFEDAGPGIPASEQETVFQPFRRLETSRNTATGGVGLGLTIAREAVMAQGGAIELVNRMEGDDVAGLRAIVRLPLPRMAAGALAESNAAR